MKQKDSYTMVLLVVLFFISSGFVCYSGYQEDRVKLLQDSIQKQNKVISCYEDVFMGVESDTFYTQIATKPSWDSLQVATENTNYKDIPLK